MNVAEFGSELARRLAEAKCTASEEEVRREARKVRDEIRADDARFGVPEHRPFFNFTIHDRRVAVFTFFDDLFEIYIVPCDEFTLIRQSNQLAMVDTRECREMLRTCYLKSQPDLSVATAVANEWMECE